MAINMPHEGGVQLLSTMFGTTAKETSFQIFVYKSNGKFSDDDSAAQNDLIDLSLTPSILNNLSGDTAAPAALQPKILVVNGVPQVEFPEFIADFGAPLTGNENLYGYAVLAAGSSSVIFREKFTEPFVPGAGKVLRFIPTLKIGNTTAPLT